jgi:hypothetical protein
MDYDTIQRIIKMAQSGDPVAQKYVIKYGLT